MAYWRLLAVPASPVSTGLPVGYGFLPALLQLAGCLQHHDLLPQQRTLGSALHSSQPVGLRLDQQSVPR